MYIRVKITPNSKKESFIKKSENEFEISVKEKAENGAANKKILELVSIHFENPPGGVKIVNGHHHRVKLLAVGNE